MYPAKYTFDVKAPVDVSSCTNDFAAFAVNQPGLAHSNLGMYRLQLSGGTYVRDREVGLHYQIHRGIGVHHTAATRAVKDTIYQDGRQVGFCRAFTDRVSIAYLADVYVVPELRGQGLGEALVREMVESAPFPTVKWLLHTEDAHPLYRKLGFEEPNYKVMERASPPDTRG